MLKPLIVWITTNCGKVLKRWEYQITLPLSWETCTQVQKQQLEPESGTMDWFKIRKGIRHGLYTVSLIILTYMQSTP